MGTHASILAWTIPWTEEPARLQSLGSQSRTLLKGLSMHACSSLKKGDFLLDIAALLSPLA